MGKALVERLIGKRGKVNVYAQPKINGFRCRAVKVVGTTTLYSSYGNKIPMVPHINEAVNDLDCLDFTLDGELFIKGEKPQTIRSIGGRTKNLHSRYKEIQYHIFDMVSSRAQGDRLLELSGLLKSSRYDGLYSPLIKVETAFIPVSEIYSTLEYFIGEGYEGAIFRNPDGYYETKKSSHLLKLKPPRNKMWFPVIGCYEAIDIHGSKKDTLGGFFLDKGLDDFFKCGCGKLKHEQRQSIWDIYMKQGPIPSEVLLAYPEKSELGIPLQGILIDIKHNVRK